MGNGLLKSKYWLGWAAALWLVVTFVWLANDGRHHWHEFRYLYSATFYSTPELMQGRFDPGPAPVRTPEEIATWYVSELLHIDILKQLVALFGMGLKSYTIIKTIYALMLVATVGLVWRTLRNLGMSLIQSALAAGLLLINPLTVYLGFKLMGEVPSLFFSACALALFTAGIRHTDFPSQAVLSSVAGFFIALAMLASAKMPLLFLGFWAALLLAWVPAGTRKDILTGGIISAVAFLTAMLVIFRLQGGRVDILYGAIIAFSGFSKPFPMWMFAIFNLGIFGMGLWFFLPLAWLSSDKRCRRFFIVWLVFSAVPVLITAADFLEPRYLVTALIPFAGLAALGLEALWNRLRGWDWGYRFRVVMASVLGVIVIGGAAAAQPFMPYESDTNRLVRIIQSQAPRPESAVILIPWNYSDFHFLRFAFPDRPIYLVQSAANEEGKAVEDPIWTARFAAMYGDYYLPSAKDLAADISNRRLLYVGWTMLPSLQNLLELLKSLRLDRLASYLESTRFRNHMTESWLVHDSAFAMREIARDGQYEVYDVKYRKFPEPPTQTASTHPVASREIPLWGMFETAFHNDRKYANPFVDTELEATFSSPSGKTYNFFGFYDGNGSGGQSGETWKLRFMCTEIGNWLWSAAFTDGAPGGSGSFRCVKSSLPGPLEVDKKNPRWLKKANGGYFFPRWYYLHELLFTKEGVWQQDIENLLVRNGYNMVTVLTTQADVLVSNGWSRREYEEPFFYPWIKNGGAVFWNTMDLTSWQKLDQVLQYLGDRNIYVYFFDGFFPNIPPRFPDNPIKEKLYLRYALARIGAYWNVTHNITFEFSDFMSTSRMNRIGRYIKEIDPFKRLLTVHDTQKFDALVQSEDWIDLANLQYKAGRAPSAKVSNAFALAHYVGKPVLSTEVLWEGGGKLNGDQVRRAAWGSLLAGSISLYAEFLPLNYGKGEGHKYLKIMLDFFSDIPYWTMNPLNELVNSGNFCLADPGKEYVVYAENGEPILINLSAAGGELQVTWLNPRTGESIPAAKVNGGVRQNFFNPASDRNDWVLHLKRLGQD